MDSRKYSNLVGKIKHDSWVERIAIVVIIASGCVDKDGLPVCGATIAFVNVTEYVILGFDSFFYRIEQMQAPCPSSVRAEITMTYSANSKKNLLLRLEEKEEIEEKPT